MVPKAIAKRVRVGELHRSKDRLLRYVYNATVLRGICRVISTTAPKVPSKDLSYLPLARVAVDLHNSKGLWSSPLPIL